MTLTPYQRGNRDGLLSAAEEFEELSKAYEREAEVWRNSRTKQADRLAEAQGLKAYVYASVAKDLRRYALALPLDPLDPEAA